MASAARTPLLHERALRARLAEARTQTDELFAYIRRNALYDRPIPERHRLIFYLGHLEAFDWNLLARGAADLAPFEERFDKLFAFGIDPVGGGLPDDRPDDWPSQTEVRNYNLRVRGTLDALLEDPPAAAAANADFASGTLLEVAIEHRLMHAETLAYLMHQLPYHRKLQAPVCVDVSDRPPSAEMKEIPEGTATLGKARGTSFGWDNEFEKAMVEVEAFRVDVYAVTNALFLEFVRAGGYQDRALWSAEDWQWLERMGLQHPLYWRPRGQQWFWRGMFAEVPLPLAWPVYVSHAEASAYARWVGKKLPTEAQWHRMAYGTAAGPERQYPWGDTPPSRRFGNFNFQSWDPMPVEAHPAGQSDFGVRDLLGNGWEWTSSVFAPLPGFAPFSFYSGYSANFFDGHHYVMKGGSQRTANCMLRRTFRNWFQPHYCYPYAKFRCVEA
jgi:gamma-glutamyl hercynylcysteine S-oxide synthase